MSRRSVCPHDCPDQCGFLVQIEDGRIVGVAGDPDQPSTRGVICAKARRYAERVYSRERLLYPQRRRGPKGSGAWERVSWDEAIAEIAERFHQIVRQYGSEAILPYSYAGTEGTVNKESMDRRFFNRLGASQLDRTICAAAAIAGYTHTMSDGRGIDPEETVHARYLISWGANLASTNLHQLSLFQTARRRGAKHVVVDVHRNRTASFADWFIPIRPGTDTALALGLMHVIIAEDLCDWAFIGARTVGFDGLAARAAEFPPERVERITGVPAADVVRLAREYATTRPSLIRIGNGPQHHSNGGMIVRTITCLPALVGAWRDVGGGAIKSNADYFALNRAALRRDDLLPQPAPRTVNMVQLGHALTELKGPPIYGLYVYNSNPMAVAPDSEAVRRGLRREDLFTVVHEQLLTDTAANADIVLPATTHFEHTDLYPAYWHLYLQIADPVIDRVGEAKPNVEVFQLLARAMGFDEPCFQDSTDDLIRQALDQPSSPFLRGITLEGLREKGWERLRVESRTPLGSAPDLDEQLPRIAFCSERLAELGHDPLPAYEPPAEIGDGETGPADPRYPLAFVTPPSHFFLNSTYADMPSNRRDEVRPTLQIHPRDAAARGIEEGDLVRVYNDRGACHLYATITTDTLPGQVISQGLWWGRWTPDGRGVNSTTPQRLSDLGGGATFFSNAVEVERVATAEADGAQQTEGNDHVQDDEAFREASPRTRPASSSR